MNVQDKGYGKRSTSWGRGECDVKWGSNHGDRILARGREFNVQTERVGTTDSRMTERSLIPTIGHGRSP